MFFDNRKEKQQGSVHFSDVDLLVIERNEKHMELVPGEQLIRYRNLRSSTGGATSFPAGYFDQKEAAVSQDSICLIAAAFNRLFLNRTPEFDLFPLPPGASRDVYMRFSFLGTTGYYTNTHTASSGFQINKEPVAEEFVQLEQLFEQHCSFPEWMPQKERVQPAPAIVNKINGDLALAHSHRIIGYRYIATGVAYCEFYQSDVCICSVSELVAPSMPLSVFGNGIRLKSDYSVSNIVPGLTRVVCDEISGKTLFQIAYKERGKYVINESIEVYCSTEKYAFYCSGRLIATIKRNNSGMLSSQPMPKAGYVYQLSFEADIDDGVPAELQTVILAFPMLRFDI